MSVFFDPSSNFHPYECDGPGRCIHCDRKIIAAGGSRGGPYSHHPADCMLCDPAYDGQPNQHWPEPVSEAAGPLKKGGGGSDSRR